MKPFFSKANQRTLLIKVSQFAKANKIKLYLVGGILRDKFLGREKETPDFDFCLKREAIKFGHKLAHELDSGFVVLDEENGACRLVKKTEAGLCTLDFSDFRDQTLEKDLLHRDFTINAMAIELEQVFSDKEWQDFIIDPYNAKEDLQAKVIRAVNKKTFDEDPLRILRAFSLSAIFGFKIEKKTLELAKSKRAKLTKVSYERIRDELFKILDRPCAFDYLLLLDKLKILKVVIPEIEVMRGIKQGPYHHLDVWKHTLEAIKQFESLLCELKNNKDIQSYLKEVVSGDRKRSSLIKFGVLLHDIGKPRTLRHEKGRTTFHGHERVGLNIAAEINKRLKLSNDEQEALGRIILWHLRPGYLADNEEITARAKFRYFRDAAKESISILLLSIADQRATKGRLTTRKSRLYHEKVALDLIKEYFRRSREKKPVRLLNGNELMAKFKLEPSKLIGEVLSELEELQAIGKIKTKKEALREAGKLINKR
jgi:poly(A) polymerase